MRDLTVPFPEWLEPMAATLTQERFAGAEWVFERKLDGVRVLAFRRGRRVWLLTRNRKRRESSYPEVVEALAGRGVPDVVLDGEVVGLGGAVSGFARLQGRMQVADFVLRDFSSAERKELDYFVDRAADAVECLVIEGLERAQSTYNS